MKLIRSSELRYTMAAIAVAGLITGCSGSSNNGSQTDPDTDLPELADDTARIHYHRDDQNYSDWRLHVWKDHAYGSDPAWNAPQSGWDYSYEHDGTEWVAWDIPIKPDAEEIAFILHLNGGPKNWEEDLVLRIAEHGREIYQLQNDGTIYTSRPDITAPQTGNLNLARAQWVLHDTVVWGQEIEDAEVSASDYFLYYSETGGLTLNQDGLAGHTDRFPLQAESTRWHAESTSLFPHLNGRPVLTLASDDLGRVPDLLRGQVAIARYRDGELADATSLQIPGVLDDLYAEAAQNARLGLDFSEGLDFRLWAPTARNVALLVFDASTPTSLARARR
ncbi:hypothetical protein CAI21_19435 [Alkalilimnicola ehrlichii]|uniref:Uncharacterized protein n=1 Tax=Alkalilimnicola ehrlichii TaxID=351052 RepID=A0A3E0WKE6_9GAMM|nr:pullulanase-associated domain-containing protein [Alkalilimnicola ehrlichii]RFA25293.1 hypothetical protein CAI21_19435 [Alkalilimnicola ehrlichii]RFA32405.1 hypothetical protein CAL65_19635 [Alkalilimnicola ehrlichii]